MSRKQNAVIALDANRLSPEAGDGAGEERKRLPTLAETPGDRRQADLLDDDLGPGASQREINAHLLLKAWKMVREAELDEESP